MASEEQCEIDVVCLIMGRVLVGVMESEDGPMGLVGWYWCWLGLRNGSRIFEIMAMDMGMSNRCKLEAIEHDFNLARA
jgi:hypothetical protein